MPRRAARRGRSPSDLADVSAPRRGGTVKSEIERQAAFYRGYLIDDRSLGPLTVALAAIVALWFVVYLADCIGAMANANG
jgi:hypothetical protein